MPFIGNKPASVPLTSADIADSIITSAKIVDGTIVNADINASAGVVLTKLASTGTLTVDNIQFPATAVASADANNLDDYEEGTWTPEFADASSAGNIGTIGYTTSAKYTKVGNIVTIDCYVGGLNTSGMTAGDPVFIRNLPFTSSGYYTGSFYTYRVGRDASTVSSSIELGNSATALLFRLFTTNSATTNKQILVSNIVSGTSEIIFSLTYETT